MAEEKKIATGYIGNALRSVADNHTTTFADEIFDTERQKYQNEVNTDIETKISAETARAKAAEQAIIFDVSAHNDGAVFESLQALLGNSNLDTLIPVSFRHGGMTIRYVQSSDNKYVQFRLMSNVWSTTVADWQGSTGELKAGKDLLESGAVDGLIKDIQFTLPEGSDIRTETISSVEDAEIGNMLGTSNTRAKIYVDGTSNTLITAKNDCLINVYGGNNIESTSSEDWTYLSSGDSFDTTNCGYNYVCAFIKAENFGITEFDVTTLKGLFYLEETFVIQTPYSKCAAKKDVDSKMIIYDSALFGNIKGEIGGMFEGVDVDDQNYRSRNIGYIAIDALFKSVSHKSDGSLNVFMYDKDFDYLGQIVAVHSQNRTDIITAYPNAKYIRVTDRSGTNFDVKVECHVVDDIDNIIVNEITPLLNRIANNNPKLLYKLSSTSDTDDYKTTGDFALNSDGYFYNTILGMSNKLMIDKYYAIDTRTIVCDVIAGSNATVCVGHASIYSDTKLSFGTSTFGLDFNNEKFIIYKPGGSTVSTSATLEEAQSFVISNLSNYSGKLVRIKIENITTRSIHVLIECIDNVIEKLFETTVTSTSSSTPSWGLNWGKPYVYSLGASISVKSLCEMCYLPTNENLKLYLIGDSITEGDTNNNPETVWSRIISNEIKNGLTSGQRAETSLDKSVDPLNKESRLKSELAILKPEYVVISYGANRPGGAATFVDESTARSVITPNLERIVEYCESQGCKVILSHIWRWSQAMDTSTRLMPNGTPQYDLVEELIEECCLKYNLDTIRFDIATSTNYSLSNYADSSMYNDELHLNAKGNQESAKRCHIDIPYLF